MIATVSLAGDASASHGVEADRQRLNQTEFLEAEVCGVELLRRHNEIFGQAAVALHAKGLVVLAGIRAGPRRQAAHLPQLV
jgi:hypothetical protein